MFYNLYIIWFSHFLLKLTTDFSVYVWSCVKISVA